MKSHTYPEFLIEYQSKVLINNKILKFPCVWISYNKHGIGDKEIKVEIGPRFDSKPKS